MSTEQPSHSDSRTPITDNSPSVRERSPYAQPHVSAIAHGIDAVLIDAIRASAGPYVPEPWRSRPPETSDEPVRMTVVTVPQMTAQVAAAAPLEVENVLSQPSIPDALMSPSELETDLTSTDNGADLPWIDAFADTSDEVDAATFADFSEDADEAVEVPSEVAPVLSHVTELVSDAPTSASSDVDESNAEWPMMEAGDALRALADELVSRDATAPAVSGELEPDGQVIGEVTTPEGHEVAAVSADESTTETAHHASATPLPMWSDDDMMDIMPVSKTPESSMAGHWSGDAAPAESRAETPDQSQSLDHGNREAVAVVLEALAKRARAGELAVPGNATDMGDAAVLAATLASLLGARK